MHQLHAETGSLELVRVQHAHEVLAVLRVLQIGELVLQRRSDPLNRMAEQVEQQEALHLEADVGIENDSQAVEDARSGRLEVPELDSEAVLDHARADASPQIDQVADGPFADS